MAGSRFSFSSCRFCLLLLFFLCLAQYACAETQYVTTEDSEGNTVYLADDRRPALYTGNFGDCMGDSLLNVTRFDAAYYKDNMTVIFHLMGSTAVKNESLMLYIGVYAYGESRFTLTFNPCNANINSLCPMNASIPIEASGVIPVSQSDVATIPSIALSIPDFEGQAVIRVFANSTETQIGCFSAVITNGASFSHPAAIGSILGVMTVIVLVASFATAIYGDHIPTIRNHYAHSLSVFVVFAIFHHVYYTGALSMNWPSVLAAYWSNFAWAAGMIYSEKMQNSINQLIGSNKGNLTMVGAAASGSSSSDIGTYSISDIYKRSVNIFHRDINIHSHFLEMLKTRELEHRIYKRDLTNSTDGYQWYGSPVKPGLPLPGNYSGFPGTLSEEGIPASNAFMTGFLWFLILVVCVAAAVVVFKGILEGMSRLKMIHSHRFDIFRKHWLGYTGEAVLRICFIGFFMMMFLAIFQFAFEGIGAATAIAGIVFIIFLVGMVGVSFYSIYYRIRGGVPDRLIIERKTKMKVIPWYGFARESEKIDDDGQGPVAGSLPWWRSHKSNTDPEHLDSETNIHENEDFQKKFGWLAARFRRTRWWFFAVWIIYEFVRACFHGAAVGHPMVQVFGLLIVEIIAFIAMITLKPFEASRLNALMVYLLGFSKVTTLALAAAFDIQFGLNRITTTVIGVVIIVIQSILVIAMLIAVVAGAISSYMSITKDKETFKPLSWTGMRNKYLAHVEKAARDLPPPPPPIPEEPKEPYFAVSSVKRYPKIEDEDPDNVVGGDAESDTNAAGSVSFPPPGRTASMRSQMSYSSLPYGARPHRASWSSRDFMHEGEPSSFAGMHQMKSDGSLRESVGRVRSTSRASITGRAVSRVGTPILEVGEETRPRLERVESEVPN
ncbi:MAG: hypothetical protein M1834_009286 [Cirrosporium novae-zelandiae]|nr:MAG: hypothetical protein M1834_009286 [Cirrosporium novae-zelandiae]